MKKSVWTFLALLTVGVTQTAWGEEAPKDSTKVVDIEEVVVIATPPAPASPLGHFFLAGRHAG